MTYGSVVNRIMENSRYPEITIGMGATVCMYSDRNPYTVVAVRYAKDGKTIREIDIRGDHVGPNKRTWPAQEYDITPASTEVCEAFDREACEHDKDHESHIPVQTWRMDSRGRLRKTYISRDTGRRVMAPRQSDGILLGSRDYYQDPSF
jgi:hypothetical protein